MKHRSAEFAEVTPCRSWKRPLAWVVVLTLVLNPLLVLGQEGDVSTSLRVGDKVKLSVPGRPDLDSELVLDQGGYANIPQVGDVLLAGMSREEASLFIKQKLRLFYPNIDTLHLEVSRGGATNIYVMGQVARPGTQSFDYLPSLWDVIRSAGGPTEEANLRLARVIRDEEGIPQVNNLDLSGLMEGRAFPAMELRDGDTLIIPALLEGTSGVPSAEGVKVFGGVGVSTIVPIEDPMPMLDVIMLAGAPSDVADMEKVYWVHEDGGKAVSTLINLDLYLKEGNPMGNPQVYPGDTLHVTIQRQGWFRANVPWILASVAAVITILLGYDRLVNDRN
ncbi:MAG: polysaccharide biosynthesis/export family protein [Candidatus Krumholzibacteriota bacterium]